MAPGVLLSLEERVLEVQVSQVDHVVRRVQDHPDFQRHLCIRYSRWRLYLLAVLAVLAILSSSNKQQTRWSVQSRLIHNPGSRHCHLAIGHCTILQRVLDCKYLSCKICFNVLNYVFILFIFNLYCLVNIQQHCHNSSHCD